MRRLITLLTLGALLGLGGCAALNRLDNEVSTYGAWPSERRPAAFVFERLPSQETRPQQQQLLEDSARGSLQQAGFVETADPEAAQYLVQVGARVVDDSPWVYNGPLFWRGGYGWGGYPGWGYSGWGHPGWGYGSRFGFGWGAWDSAQTFSREVALVIRDRRHGQILYEARANNRGPSASIDYLLPAMFEAAMKDFPAIGPSPHNVTIDLSKKT